MSAARLGLLFAGLLIAFDLGLSPLLGLDTDIWWHLAGGRRLSTHGLELTDPFSFTHSGERWVHIDWLFQWLTWQTYRLSGIAGLLTGRALLVATSFLLLWRVARRNGMQAPSAWLSSLFICHIAAMGVPLRPSIFSFFFTCALLVLLEEARHGRLRALWGVPPLIVLWFNIHVAALGGVLLVWLYAVGQVTKQLLARESAAKPWVATAVLAAVAPFFNPQPLILVYYPVHFTIFKSIWSKLILEVQTPGWTWPGTPEARLLSLAALAGTLRLAVRKQWDLFWVAPVSSLLLWKTYRHQFQLCPALLPALAQLGSARWQQKPAARWLFGAGVALLAFRAATSLAVYKLPADNLIRRETFPATVARTLEAHPAPLRIFTDMDSAGYYIFHNADRHGVFIDSRTDQVYLDERFVAEYLEILGGSRGALAALDRWKVNVIIQHRAVTSGSPLFTTLLPRSKEWTLAHQDNITQVYLRDVAIAWPGPEPFLQAYNAARAGDAAQAERAALEALHQYPWFSSAHQLLGRLWLEQGRLGLARSALARAELANPSAPGLQADWERLGSPWNSWAVRQFFLPFLAWR